MVTIPSPQTWEQTLQKSQQIQIVTSRIAYLSFLAFKVQLHPLVIWQFTHPGEVLLPTSHCSGEVTIPFPQSVVQTDGCPVQIYPLVIVQFTHPSVVLVFPSSLQSVSLQINYFTIVLKL
jgi:hypothetical protein